MVTYAKLEDDFPEHPKIVGLSDAAFRLYVTAICYSSRNLTDGFVPASMIRRLGGTSKTTMELTAAELWHGHVEPPGWHIHNYLKHQRSREAVLQQRAAAVERATKSKRNHGAVAPQHTRSFASQSERESKSAELKISLTGETTTRCAGDWYRMLNHREPNAVTKEMLSNLDAAHPVDCLAWAFQLAAEKDDPWRYGKSVLDSCLVEGHLPRLKEKRSGSGDGQGRRADRQGHGRGFGASQRVAGAGVDWDAEQREHERLIAGAQGGTSGTS